MAKREATTGIPADRKSDGTVRMSVSFDAEDYAEIKGIAKDKRVSAAWVVRDAVTSYLDTRVPLLARERGGTR